MTTLTLTHDTTPEVAQAEVYKAIHNHPRGPIGVRLHGFPTVTWGTLVATLPAGWHQVRISENLRMLTPAVAARAFDVSVISGRFDRSAASVADAWQAERDRGASLHLGTELAARSRSTLLGEDPRYGLIHAAGTKGEVAVEYAKADWQLVTTEAHQVWARGGPGRFSHAAYARVTILRNRHTGRLLIDVQNHDPASHVPFRIWLSVMGAQARLVRQLRHDNPGAAVMVSGDFNSAGPKLARYMAAHFPGFRAGRGFKFGNVWTVGLDNLGAAHTVHTPSSDHPIKRLRLGFK